MTLTHFVWVRILVPQPQKSLTAYTVRLFCDVLILIIKAEAALKTHEAVGIIVEIHHIHRGRECK